jgi:hypothetical protein
LTATYNKFQPFVANIANGKYNLASDTLDVALSSVIPTAGMDALTSITQISYTNLSARVLTVASSTQTAGLYKLMINNLTLTASGAVASFQYVTVYDATATSHELIGWFDYGSSVTLANGDQFIINFDQTNGLLQIT